MGLEQIEDRRIFFKVELAREQIGAERQAERIGSDEGARTQLDIAVRYPVDRAKIIVHHLALVGAVHDQRLENGLVRDETATIEGLETRGAGVMHRELAEAALTTFHCVPMKGVAPFRKVRGNRV